MCACVRVFQMSKENAPLSSKQQCKSNEMKWKEKQHHQQNNFGWPNTSTLYFPEVFFGLSMPPVYIFSRFSRLIFPRSLLPTTHTYTNNFIHRTKARPHNTQSKRSPLFMLHDSHNNFYHNVLKRNLAFVIFRAAVAVMTHYPIPVGFTFWHIQRVTYTASGFGPGRIMCNKHEHAHNESSSHTTWYFPS